MDLSEYEVAIFAEIVDAPRLSVEAIVARAQVLQRDGADVIDLGCLPETAFAHLEDSVRALKAEGFNFVGPTITYAFMQAAGMVDDHLATCRFGEGMGQA